MRFNVHTILASKHSCIAPFCQVNFRKFPNIFTLDQYAHGLSPPLSASVVFASTPTVGEPLAGSKYAGDRKGRPYIAPYITVKN